MEGMVCTVLVIGEKVYFVVKQTNGQKPFTGLIVSRTLSGLSNYVIGLHYYLYYENETLFE